MLDQSRRATSGGSRRHSPRAFHRWQRRADPCRRLGSAARGARPGTGADQIIRTAIGTIRNFHGFDYSRPQNAMAS
jgi:hypothetical protein